jgi:hypothetical protein
MPDDIEKDMLSALSQMLENGPLKEIEDILSPYSSEIQMSVAVIVCYKGIIKFIKDSGVSHKGFQEEIVNLFCDWAHGQIKEICISKLEKGEIDA